MRKKNKQERGLCSYRLCMRFLSWGSALRLTSVLTSNGIVLHSCRGYSLSFKFALSLVHPTPEVSEYFPSTRKLRAGVFKFLRFEEHFRNAELSRRIGVDDRPKCRWKPGVFKFLRRNVDEALKVCKIFWLGILSGDLSIQYQSMWPNTVERKFSSPISFPTSVKKCILSRRLLSEYCIQKIINKILL